MAEVKVHRTKQYVYKQSPHAPDVPELPMRAILVAPSGGGKTTLLVSMILDIYRGCWERIYVFSPSVFLDDAWKPVKNFCEKVLKQPEDDPWAHDVYNDAQLIEILDRQRTITELAKRRKMTHLFGCLVIVDDFADNERVCRRSPGLHQIYTRGRHAGVTCVCSVQKYRVLANIMRVNATDLFVFRLRSKAEEDAIVEENSATYGKDATEALLREATREPYSFLWLNARAKEKEDLFWKRFDCRLVPGNAGRSP